MRAVTRDGRTSGRVAVQVWAEPDRAGRSSVVLDESDLDALAARLTGSGLDRVAPQRATSSRILLLQDPDGNRIVFTGR